MGYIGQAPANKVVRTADIEDSAITSAKILDGTIVNADVNASAAIAESKLSITAFDDNQIQNNIALLGFKTAVNGDLAKYNLVDQIVDEYEDATGIDAGNSTNESLVSGSYSGDSAPTQDADATGTDGGDTWYKWTDTASTGSFTPAANGSYDFLVIAGGGSGSFGGGGAGGFRTSYGSGSISGRLSTVESNLSLVSGTAYTITVGAGRAPSDTGSRANTGDDSSIAGSDITDVVSLGGGMGGGATSNVGGGTAGGSGGGAGYDGADGSGGAAGTAAQGFDGGDNGSGESGAGGGGGAGGAGGNGSGSVVGGAGGAGLASSITGSAVTYAGGGGGSYNGAAGSGGAGAGRTSGHADWTALQPTGGTASPNTGSGGGGVNGGEDADYGGSGGSGIVIIRGATPVAADLTLQSTDTTASTANPDYANMICLIENAAGTATLNTDIKGYVSEDSGVTFTQGTFVDEGTWGTNKKIIAFHDLDISAQSGSSMCYKITTHNQSAGSKETKIHATSIGWR